MIKMIVVVLYFSGAAVPPEFGTMSECLSAGVAGICIEERAA